MSRKSSALRMFAALAAVALLAGPTLAESKKGAKKEKPAAAADADAPTTKHPIKLLPEGMTWGMEQPALEKLVAKFIDEDYKPKYKAAGKSAPRLKDLDAEVSTLKAAFHRSRIELVDGPTGLDASPIAPEYTKGNNEAIMSHHRGPGVKIWFFFFGTKLWKTIEEVSLIDGGLYGKDVAEATKKILDSVGGTLPRATPANPDKGSFYDIFDWQDSVTHMRLWDRSGVLVIAREERATLANLASLRKNTVGAKNKVDPSVSGVMRDKDPPPKDEKKPKKLADDRAGSGRCGRPCFSLAARVRPLAVVLARAARLACRGRLR
jgi:hypothetical protein